MRGILWLAVGAAAVVVDVIVATGPGATPRGRRAGFVLAVLTGALFLTFAGGTFAETGWSIIH